MTLIVEDGTGKADAESYITVAAATYYHLAMGNTAWAALASDTIREQLLRKATAYMLQMYGQRLSGYRTTNTQALDLPRAYMTDARKNATGCVYYVATDTIPVEFKNACALLALKAATITLLPDVEPTVTSESIAGAISVTYDTNSTPYTTFTEIDFMLSPFFVNAGSKGFIHR